MIIYFDINIFKNYNFELGHNKGDEVLKDIEDIIENYTSAYIKKGAGYFFEINHFENEDISDEIHYSKKCLLEIDTYLKRVGLTMCCAVVNNNLDFNFETIDRVVFNLKEKWHKDLRKNRMPKSNIVYISNFNLI